MLGHAQACINSCHSSECACCGRAGVVVGGSAAARCTGSRVLRCCWVLMSLLFAGGVMNLAIIAALMLIVLLEKIAPQRRVADRAGALGHHVLR